ncbi:MAG: S8 family serine peptidase [Thermoplasmata archaeon]
MPRPIEKLTEAVERIAYQLPIVPVIVEAKRGRFETLLAAVRGFLSEGRFMQLVSEFFPLIRSIPAFDYVATLLPREWVFDLADAAEVEKVYPNLLKFAFKYATVPEEGVFVFERGAFKEIAPFTTTYYTKRLLGADIAHKKGFFGSGVRVAVVDTGVSRRHPATKHMIADSVIAQIRDENGHGEWCCACIGGVYAKDAWISRRIGKVVPTEGVAPRAYIVGMKALGYVIGVGSDDAILKAIETSSFRYKVDIINMSLGGKVEWTKQEDSPYFKVVKELTERGVIFCVAAGNEGPGAGTISDPGALEDVLTVGAYDPLTGQVADFSSRGPTVDGRVKPDCIAPGVNIHAPCVGLLDKAGDNTHLNNFSPLSGTSMATPHISGLLALMREAMSKTIGKILTTEEVKKMLQEIGEEKNNVSGCGLLTWQMFETWMDTQYGVRL